MLLIVCILHLILGAASFKTAILSIVTARDVLYINEWLDYHNYLGFHHVYLVDETNGMHRKLESEHKHFVTVLDGSGKDFSHYFNVVRDTFDNEAEVLCLGVDDFVVLKTHSDIHEMIGAKGMSTLTKLPVYRAISTRDSYYPSSILERFTLRAAHEDMSFRHTVLTSMLNGFDRDLSVTSDDAYVMNYALHSREEQRWQVEWLCDNQRIASPLTNNLLNNFGVLCSRMSVLEWRQEFDALYDATRQQLLSEELVEDRRAWQVYSTLLQRKKEANQAAYHDQQLYNQLILTGGETEASENIALEIGIGLRAIEVPDPISITLTIYGDRDVATQLIQFCIDRVVSLDDCTMIIRIADARLLAQAKAEVTSGGGGFGRPAVMIDEQRIEEAFAYYKSLYTISHPTALELLSVNLLDESLRHRPEECARGWKRGDGVLEGQGPFLMYVVSHDDASEQAMLSHVYGSSSAVEVGNGLLVPVRIRSSVFFEYSVYREVLPALYHTQWSGLPYVGITTYKTLMRNSPLCGFEVRRLLEVARSHDYDVVPFIRSKQDLLIRSVLNHGRGFRYAWDAVLMALGYDLPTIRQYDFVKPFYRSSMLIKPAWLRRLSEFMSRAIEAVQFNASLYELCSSSAHYNGDPDVSMRIFNVSTYQLFPFIFERLPAFYLAAEGAKVCMGEQHCQFNSFWF